MAQELVSKIQMAPFLFRAVFDRTKSALPLTRGHRDEARIEAELLKRRSQACEELRKAARALVVEGIGDVRAVAKFISAIDAGRPLFGNGVSCYLGEQRNAIQILHELEVGPKLCPGDEEIYSELKQRILTDFYVEFGKFVEDISRKK